MLTHAWRLETTRLYSLLNNQWRNEIRYIGQIGRLTQKIFAIKWCDAYCLLIDDVLLNCEKLVWHWKDKAPDKLINFIVISQGKIQTTSVRHNSNTRNKYHLLTVAAKPVRILGKYCNIMKALKYSSFYQANSLKKLIVRQ